MSEKIKKYLENQVYEYIGPLFWDGDFKIPFKYKIKLNGFIELISIGDLKKYVSVDIIIVEMPEQFLTVFGYLFNQLTDRQKVEREVYGLANQLKQQVRDEILHFNLDVPVVINAIRLDKSNT